jgi:hypothetical protein
LFVADNDATNTDLNKEDLWEYIQFDQKFCVKLSYTKCVQHYVIRVY